MNDYIQYIDDNNVNNILKMKMEHDSKDYLKYKTTREYVKMKLRHELDHMAQRHGKITIQYLIKQKYGETHYSDLFRLFLAENEKVINNFGEFDKRFLNILREKFEEISSYYLKNNEIASLITEFRSKKLSGMQVIIDIKNYFENFLFISNRYENYEFAAHREEVKKFLTIVILTVTNFYTEAMLMKYPNEKLFDIFICGTKFVHKNGIFK